MFIYAPVCVLFHKYPLGYHHMTLGCSVCSPGGGSWDIPAL